MTAKSSVRGDQARARAKRRSQTQTATAFSLPRDLSDFFFGHPCGEADGIVAKDEARARGDGPDTTREGGVGGGRMVMRRVNVKRQMRRKLRADSRP